jgi:hypothetical protein
MTGDNQRHLGNVKSQSNGVRPRSTSFPVRIVKRIGRIAWYLVRKTAYIVFLLGAVALILIGLEKAAEVALWKSPMSYVYPKDFGLTKRNLTTPASHYDYDLSPGVCFLYNQEKGNRYEYANNAGFRDPRDISLVKPDDEFRIFLTGGSTAFGLGAAGQSAHAADNYYLEHRETISHMLEKILNATAPIPGKKIRVYNTAVWGYAYQHLLFRYPTKLRQYKPDMVVSLDGANEIHPISIPEKDWNYFDQGQFHGILKEIFAYSGDGLGAYLTLWLKNNTFLMAFIWRGMDPFFAMETGMRLHQGAALAPDEGKPVLGMTQDERSRMITHNVDAVAKVVDDYHAILENDGVPHLFALQPMLYLSKKPRHEMEKRVEAIEEHKQYYDLPTDSLYKFLIERITDSAQKKQYFVADLSEYFDDTSEWVFTDWCHLTAGANYLLAKELGNLIKQHFFKMPLTDGDKVESKDSFFRNPTANAKIVYTPPPENPEKGPQNFLTGYPGAVAYSSRKVSADERLEIVLDLGKIFTLGRLRLVWEDDSSVPSEWVVDVSRDGATWKEWVRGSDKELDTLSWWPGYEYYGTEPVHAQYLRYRPIVFADRSIGLRCLRATR